MHSICSRSAFNNLSLLLFLYFMFGSFHFGNFVFLYFGHVSLLFFKVFILQGKKGKTEIFKINKRNTLWRKSRNQSDQNMKKTKLRKWDEPDITVNTKMLHWVNCLLINLFVQSYNPILNLRILNIFHEICYLFWSAQKLENQNLSCNCLVFIKKET